MFFTKGRILSQTQLKRLSDHKYNCESKSVLDSLLQPWWNFLVSQVPLWLAPNLITLIGLAINIITTLILIFYSSDAKSHVPWWAFLLCALGLFAYQSLDAIDGKQARRTGTSSPLGELFDHGCDSVSTVFVALSACIAVQLGTYPSWMFFQCFCAVTLFYCAHWQAYVSGMLRFGRIDVTEAQFTIMGIHLISAIFGVEIWSTQIFPLLSFVELRHIILLMTLGACTEVLYALFLLLCKGGVGKNGSTVAIPIIDFSFNEAFSAVFLAAFARVFLEFCPVLWTGGAGKNGSTVAIPGINLELKQLQVILGVFVAIYMFQATISVIFGGGVGKNGSSVAGTSVLSPIIPLSLVVIPAYIICRKSNDHVYENNPVLYILAFGLVGAKVTNRLVVAHMTRNEMDYLDSSLIGPAMLFLNQYFNFFFDEYIVLWVCLIWVTFDLLRYCRHVCLEICEHMHIQLFRIVPITGSVQQGITASSGTPANKNAHHSEEVILELVEDEAPLLDSTDDEDDVVLFEASRTK